MATSMRPICSDGPRGGGIDAVEMRGSTGPRAGDGESGAARVREDGGAGVGGAGRSSVGCACGVDGGRTDRRCSCRRPAASLRRSEWHDRLATRERSVVRKQRRPRLIGGRLRRQPRYWKSSLRRRSRRPVRDAVCPRAIGTAGWRSGGACIRCAAAAVWSDLGAGSLGRVSSTRPDAPVSVGRGDGVTRAVGGACRPIDRVTSLWRYPGMARRFRHGRRDRVRSRPRKHVGVCDRVPGFRAGSSHRSTPADGPRRSAPLSPAGSAVSR